MNKYGRSRKEQNRDRKDKHQDMETHVRTDAKKWLEHEAFKPWHKKPMPRYDVIGYLKAKGHDVKGDDADG